MGVFDAGAENSGLGGLLGNRLTPERAARFAARRINKMNKAGLSTYTYMSEMGSEIICLIGASDKVTEELKSTPIPTGSGGWFDSSPPPPPPVEAHKQPAI